VNACCSKAEEWRTDCHLLIGHLPRYSISEIVRDIKSNTSKWIHETWTDEFAWQEGYGVFSVSTSHIEKTKEYIRNQEEHHKKHSFEDELRRFKKMHGLSTEDDAPPPPKEE
jgi:putative transposase